MKTFLIRFLIALACCAIFAGIVNGQTPKQYLSDNWKSLTCVYFAGVCDGTVEILRHDYTAFKKVFPNINDSLWKPELTWRNKWKNGDPAQGEKFLFSSSWLVGATDPYHRIRTAQKFCVVGAIVFTIGGKKEKFSYYVYKAVGHSIMYSLGFTTTYEFIFKHGK